jgi:hypothetical protein
MAAIAAVARPGGMFRYGMLNGVGYPAYKAGALSDIQEQSATAKITFTGRVSKRFG